MTLHIALCDDDKYALNNEVTLINDVLNEKGIEHSIDTFNSPQELLRSDTVYNIVFLDIEMDEMNGLKVAEHIKRTNKSCLFFFVTNYEKYLDEALNQHAFRFWTKPIDKRKLVYGIDSALKELQKENQFIDITVNNSKVQVFINNIIYIVVQNKKTHIFTTKGEIVSNVTYQSVFEQLKKYGIFFEPHRGYCVNFRYIRNYDKDKIYCSYKFANYEIYLSRRKYEEFQRKFIKWIGEE